MSSSDISDVERLNIDIKKKRYLELKKKGWTDETSFAANEYHDAVIDAILTGDISIEPGCGADPDPSRIHVKEGGWGGDTASPKLWDVVAMKDDPAQFKIVDKAGKNIAHKFATKQEADRYVKYHQCMEEKGDTDPGPIVIPEPPTTPPGGPSPGEYPYPAKGTPMQGVKKGPLTRHYASGKPDDKTVEMNVKSIPFDNYQWVTYTTMHKIEHDDNISVKFGGVHQGGGGWFDCGISFEGQTCLGVEPKHPSTKLCVVKGPKLSSVLEKKVGVAGVYHKKENHIELWIDMGDGWKKACEGKDVAGLKPNEASNETQLRIDGFEDEPTIHSAVVTEI